MSTWWLLRLPQTNFDKEKYIYIYIPDTQHFQTGQQSMKIPEDVEVVKFMFFQSILE